MELTISYIERKFDLYNKKYFDGSLRKPSFKISKSKTQLGYLQTKFIPFKFYTLGVSVYYDRTEKQYDETIIHEMIHLYISQQGIKDNGAHGNRFKAECARINKDGWSLSRVTNISNWKISKEFKTKKFNVFCYETRHKGTFFIFCVSDSNISKYENYLKNKGYDYKLYIGVTDEKFYNFPICRTSIRGFMFLKGINNYFERYV